MKFIKLFSLVVLSVSMVFILNSCTETTTPTTNPQPKPSPVTNLMATSINDSTVKIKFDLSPSQTDPLFKDYLLSYYETLASTPLTVILNSGTNSYTVSGLTEGKIYYFDVIARYTNDSVSTNAVIQWSPASRFEKNDADEIIKVYETESQFGSGLQLFNPAISKASVSKKENSANWDLALYTKNDSIIFGSATALNYVYANTPKATQLCDEFAEATSLDDLFDSKSLISGTRATAYSEQAFSLSGVNPTKNLIFFVRKINDSGKYNYAKVMISKNPNGFGYLQGNPTDRFLEIQISYQKTADVPYAKVAQNNDSK
jgi:hypothetical protein